MADYTDHRTQAANDKRRTEWARRGFRQVYGEYGTLVCLRDGCKVAEFDWERHNEFFHS